MRAARFEIHKWHTNINLIEPLEDTSGDDDTYAKTVTGNPNAPETKILGTPWDKSEDKLAVSIDCCLKTQRPLTKRKMITAINSVYDALGWSSPVMITAKLLFGEVCLLKAHWDLALAPDIQ